MAKETKRTKINFNTVNSNINSTIEKLRQQGKVKPIDMTKYYEDRKKRIEADKKRYERESKAEKQRIEKLKCPNCKSTDKKNVIISHRDGPLIVGGRNAVSLLAEYNVCQKCGVMYVDLLQKDIQPPESDHPFL